MYAEWGPAYACALGLQALQYVEKSFAWKYIDATKSDMHITTLAFQALLLVQDTTDNENKRWRKRKEDRG